MKWNFSSSIQDIPSAYRRHLEELITGHLHGTYQNIRLMNQQGDLFGYERTTSRTAHAILDDGFRGSVPEKETEDRGSGS